MCGKIFYKIFFKNGGVKKTFRNPIVKKVFGSRERYLGSKAPSPTCQVPQKTVVSEVFRNVKENLFFSFFRKTLDKCSEMCIGLWKCFERN